MTRSPTIAVMVSAVLFDFGGVITTSPFEAFAKYERENDLPDGFIRQINSTNPDTNAWSKLERSDVDHAGFAELFEAEARALGHELDGIAVIGLLSGDVRPEMVEAVRRCNEKLTTACLTNNFNAEHGDGSGTDPADATRADDVRAVMKMFSTVVESRKVGVRKPEPRFYELACEHVGIQPADAVFLDDLGINLKPARAMGMTTIKVTSASQALTDLEAVVGFPLR